MLQWIELWDFDGIFFVNGVVGGVAAELVLLIVLGPEGHGEPFPAAVLLKALALLARATRTRNAADTDLVAQSKSAHLIP